MGIKIRYDVKSRYWLTVEHESLNSFIAKNVEICVKTVLMSQLIVYWEPARKKNGFENQSDRFIMVKYD